MSEYSIFTSESVSEGHPDKIADAISDRILDEMLAQDPTSHVAVETLVATGQVMVCGEVTTEAYADISSIARQTIVEIGYSTGINEGLVIAAVMLILVGAVSKSALIPFHFWLPAAMEAPTPVSAYLHAAAMVKAGVFLVALAYFWFYSRHHLVASAPEEEFAQIEAAESELK